MSSPEIRCSHAEVVAVGELKPHPKNPNQHPAEQVELLGKIISHQGWRRPVRVSRLSGFITAGHGALLAAKAMGWESVPVDYQDYETEQDELADLVADNRIAELADLDQKAVDEILADLDDVELAGFFEAEEGEDEQLEPEVPFSEVMDEANNYVVLVFKNEVDWLQAQTHFNLQSVRSRRMNGKPHSRGVGRVLDGATYLREVAK